MTPQDVSDIQSFASAPFDLLLFSNVALWVIAALVVYVTYGLTRGSK